MGSEGMVLGLEGMVLGLEGMVLGLVAEWLVAERVVSEWKLTL